MSLWHRVTGRRISEGIASGRSKVLGWAAGLGDRLGRALAGGRPWHPPRPSKQTIMAMRKRGVTWEKIAAQFQVSPSTVKGWCGPDCVENPKIKHIYGPAGTVFKRKSKPG